MKKRRKNILILSAIGIIGLLAYWGMSVKQVSCRTLLPVSQSNELINRLDQDATKFASTSKEIVGQSAEGGQQIEFRDKVKLQIVEQRFYGETGKSFERFYYSGDRIFAITKLNLSYEVPIYVDPKAKIKSSEKKDFYLDKSGVVCTWFLNDTEQAVDKDTIDMIKQYISGIQ